MNDRTEEKLQNNSKKYEEPSSEKTIENMTHDVYDGVVVPKVNNNPCEQIELVLTQHGHHNKCLGHLSEELKYCWEKALNKFNVHTTSHHDIKVQNTPGKNFAQAHKCITKLKVLYIVKYKVHHSNM